MQKLKIAHVICDLGPGGGQKSTIDLINATNKDFENHLILLENRRDYEPENLNISFVCENKKIYKKLNRFGDWLLSKKLEKILKDKDIDIVVSHMEVTAKVIAFINLSKIYYMRVDITQELDDLKTRSKSRYLQRKKLYKKIFDNQNLITISKDSEKNIKEFITPKKIETIYNAFDFPKIDILLKKENSELINDEYIIQIGSGFKVKGQDTLLRAFSKIQNKEIKLLLLGTSEYPELRNLIQELNIQERVVLKAFTTNPYPYIKNAKLLVISSLREGLPRVMVESLYLETPVVSTDCKTGPREILVDELENYLAKVGDYKELAEKIDMAIENYPKDFKKHTKKFFKDVIVEKYKNYIGDIS